MRTQEVSREMYRLLHLLNHAEGPLISVTRHFNRLPPRRLRLSRGRPGGGGGGLPQARPLPPLDDNATLSRLDPISKVFNRITVGEEGEIHMVKGKSE